LIETIGTSGHGISSLESPNKNAAEEIKRQIDDIINSKEV